MKKKGWYIIGAILAGALAYALAKGIINIEYYDEGGNIL